MFRDFHVWFKLLGFDIRNFYHLTPYWSRSSSCIHSIVIICRRTLNQNALCKVPVEKWFNLVVLLYPTKKSDFVTEIMTVLHNYKKKITKIKCHETHICPATQVRPKQKENTQQERICCWNTEVFPKSSQVQHRHPTFDSYHRSNIIF